MLMAAEDFWENRRQAQKHIEESNTLKSRLEVFLDA